MRKYLVRQDDENDCGACCLSSIIKYYNGFIPLEIIKFDTITTNKGTSFYNIKKAAANYGFNVKGVFSYELDNINLPCIIQIKDNNLYHFCVIYKIAKEITIMDPAKGFIKYKKDEFYKIFTGNILLFEKVQQIPKYEKNNYFYKNIVKILKNNSINFIFIILLNIIIIISSLFTIYFIKIININNQAKLLTWFITFLIIKCIFSYIKNHLIIHLNKKINIRIITDYLQKFFNLPFKYVQLKNKGNITARINDLNNIKDIIISELINIIIYFLFLIFSTIILFYINKKITIYILLLNILYFIFNLLISKKLKIDYFKSLESNDNLYNNLIEYATKIKTIKNINKENYFLKRIKNNILESSKEDYTLSKKLNLIKLIKDIYNELTLIIIIILSLNNISFENIIIYIMYNNYYLDSINYFITLIPLYSHIKNIIHKLNEIYYLENKEISLKTKSDFTNVKINNLSYYINDKKVIEDFSLICNTNDKILINGKNGSGKSTLLELLFKNIDNYNGEILINNKNIKDIDKEEIKRNISYISQKSDLFIDTIKNNIILDEIYNEEKLSKIIKILEIDEILKNKNMGLDHLYNNNLSGGEKQRIILARALYRDFKILLLDEALSEVSHYSRIKIINSINYYYKDKIVIIISHNYEKYPFNKIINLTARKEKNVN